MNKVALYVDQNPKLPILPKYVERCDYVSNFKDFCIYLNKFFEEYKELPCLISINHDLTEEHILLELKRPEGKQIEYEMFNGDSGLHVCQYLNKFASEHNLYFNKTALHGMNTVGSTNMERLLNEYCKWKDDSENLAFKIKWEYDK